MRTSYTYGLLATILAALSIAGIAMAQNASTTNTTNNGSSTAPYYAPPGNNGSTSNPTNSSSTSSSTNNSSVLNSSPTTSGTTTPTGSSTPGTSQPQYGPFIVPNASMNNTTTTNTTNNVTNSTNTTPTIGMIVYPSPGMTPAAMVLRVDDLGTALIRGIVQSTSPESVTIQSWGGTWTLTTATGSTVIPQGTNGSNDLSALRVGDFVGAIGTISQTQPYTINAALVRDWTTNPLRIMLRITPTAHTNTNSTTSTTTY